MVDTQSPTYKTINTFSRFPTIYQILTYIVFILQIIAFYAVINPNIKQSPISQILTVLYTITLVTTIIFSFICSLIDPSDQIMIQQKKDNKSQFEQSLENLQLCNNCKCYTSKHSHHCRQCNRCVQHFDHHCRWINNCVGMKNYLIFIFMTISATIHFSIYIISIVFLSVQNKWHHFLRFIIPCWILLIVILLYWGSFLYLLAFHIYLKCLGVSTYKWNYDKMFKLLQESRKRLREDQQQNSNIINSNINSHLQISQTNDNLQNKDVRQKQHRSNLNNNEQQNDTKKKVIQSMYQKNLTNNSLPKSKANRFIRLIISPQLDQRDYKLYAFYSHCPNSTNPSSKQNINHLNITNNNDKSYTKLLNNNKIYPQNP